MGRRLCFAQTAFLVFFTAAAGTGLVATGFHRPGSPNYTSNLSAKASNGILAAISLCEIKTYC
jgi:hypothetical protein